MQEVSFGWAEQDKMVEDFGIYCGEDKAEDEKKFETSFNANAFSMDDLKSPVFLPTRLMPTNIHRDDSTLNIPEVKSNTSYASSSLVRELQSPGDPVFVQWVSDVETKIIDVEHKLIYMEENFSVNLNALLKELKDRAAQSPQSSDIQSIN